MMIIYIKTISSLHRPETTLSVEGETLIRDGTPFDLSIVAEGDEVEALPGLHFNGPIRRIDGVLHVPVLYFIGPTARPVQPNGGQWTIEVTADGPVNVPVERIAV
jgi:hypothetical protein